MTPKIKERFDAVYTPELRAKFVAWEHGIKVPLFENPRPARYVHLEFDPDGETRVVGITLLDDYGQSIGHYPVCQKDLPKKFEL
jgi:hypothetical protein